MNVSFFQELLTTIAERGRSLIGPGRLAGGGDHRQVLRLCEELLSSRGEASGVAIAQEVLERYRALAWAERVAFLRAASARFGIDEAGLREAASAFAEAPSAQGAQALQTLAEPRRQELIRRLNLPSGGTAALVAMRMDVLEAAREHPELSYFDQDFRHLFGSWFNRGFLVMRRIAWSTPASILAKIIAYEAVHEIRDWDDLRGRLEPEDRRCFGFFHPALVDEPLIFVEVALTRDMPGSIGDLLATRRDVVPAGEARTAVFYSISNCQTGLRGISFGNFLIKQVVEELVKELPQLETFVTLSPVPGFAAWLGRQEGEGGELSLNRAQREALEVAAKPGWHADPETAETARRALAPLAAHYFLRARDAHGRIPDPVARFHLGNGARLERINWLGDVSAKGLDQSLGLMVNYRYVLGDIERNHESFANSGEVIASAPVRRLLRSDNQSKTLVTAND